MRGPWARRLARLALGLLLAASARVHAAEPPVQEGQVVLAPDGRLYLIQGGERHAIEPRILSADEIATIPDGPPLPNNTIPLAGAASGGPASGRPAGSGGSPGGGSGTGGAESGSGASPLITLGPIAFGTEVGADRQILNPSRRFPVGTTAIYASFTVSGARDGEPWTALWLRDGQEDQRGEVSWEVGTSGRQVTALSNPQGIVPGNYEFRALQGGRVLQLGFVTVGTAPISGTMSNLAFAPAIAENYQPVDPITTFPSGTTQFYVTFDVEGIPEGATYGYRLFYEGQVLEVFDNTWVPDLAIDGHTWFTFRAREGSVLSDGRYDVTVVLNSAPLLSGSFRVGPGSPAATPTPWAAATPTASATPAPTAETVTPADEQEPAE